MDKKNIKKEKEHIKAEHVKHNEHKEHEKHKEQHEKHEHKHSKHKEHTKEHHHVHLSHNHNMQKKHGLPDLPNEKHHHLQHLHHEKVNIHHKTHAHHKPHEEHKHKSEHVNVVHHHKHENHLHKYQDQAHLHHAVHHGVTHAHHHAHHAKIHIHTHKKHGEKVESKTEKNLLENDIKDERPNSEEIKKYAEVIAKMRKEIAKSVTGQEKIIDSLIMGLLCDGHVLLEGVPGIAKTLAIKTIAIVSGCSVKRIQFTVDLLPTDITGIVTYTPGKGFETIKGPIFSNFLIADEINRSPSKTQSALIEAMQEMQVTIGKETFPLPKPFFVMATQNPIEQAGVYQLPEAQVDRFLFKLIMGYPEYNEEVKIMEQNMTLKKFEEFDIKPATTPAEILKMQKMTKNIFIGEDIKKYILNIINRTRTRDLKYGHYIEWGASPRASIALFIASKAHALMSGRNFVIPSDVKGVVHNVLRHRIILSYRARAEHIDSDKVIDEILDRESA